MLSGGRVVEASLAGRDPSTDGCSAQTSISRFFRRLLVMIDLQKLRGRRRRTRHCDLRIRVASEVRRYGSGVMLRPRRRLSGSGSDRTCWALMRPGAIQTPLSQQTDSLADSAGQCAAEPGDQRRPFTSHMDAMYRRAPPTAPTSRRQHARHDYLFRARGSPQTRSRTSMR
jgi:hypothetical protein